MLVPTADQLLARLYALRKDYADDPDDETFQALHAAFMFVSYNMSGFKEFVKNDLPDRDSPPAGVPESPTD